MSACGPADGAAVASTVRLSFEVSVSARVTTEVQLASVISRGGNGSGGPLTSDC